MFSLVETLLLGPDYQAMTFAKLCFHKPDDYVLLIQCTQYTKFWPDTFFCCKFKGENDEGSAHNSEKLLLSLNLQFF